MSAAFPFPFVVTGATGYEFTPIGAAKNWIGGKLIDAASGATLPVLNPRYGEAMGQVPDSGLVDVDAAVAAAKAAYPAWKATPIKQRAQIFYKLKQLMERDLDEITAIVSHENGKVFAQARASTLKGIECLEFGISLPNMAAGGQLDVSRGVNCRLDYEPLGVCAGIVPFNFPIMVPMWMLPQVLVAGNTFVLKPSEQVPYSCLKIAALFKEAGLPDGVLNLVNGRQETVEGIVDHPDVKAVAFVGSTQVARIVYERGAKAGKRVLSMGGAKNHLIVVPDANVELTAKNVVASAHGSAGQRCMAAAVLLAVGEVDHIVEAIVAEAQKLVLGTDMGAVINPASVERITGFIDDAERRGAKIVLDGRNAKVEGQPGSWVGPTIIDHATADMPCGCEEIFGPVLTVVRVNTLDEALAIENANAYGNAASIYTSSGATARYAIERFEAGMCAVNIGVPVPREPFGFGGWNHSKFGHGDLTGWDGYRFWTRARKVTTKWALQNDWSWMS